jgi:hypothetical protein
MTVGGPSRFFALLADREDWGGAGTNGMVVTLDNATLIVADSFARRLTAFDIAGRERLHEFSPECTDWTVLEEMSAGRRVCPAPQPLGTPGFEVMAIRKDGDS